MMTINSNYHEGIKWGEQLSHFILLIHFGTIYNFDIFQFKVNINMYNLKVLTKNDK